MEIYECISFLLIKDGNILLEKRSKDKETDPGLIAIPGGHMEENETQYQALKRELKEELGVGLNNATYLCTLHHPTPIEMQLLHFYIITDWSGDIACFEADSVDWYPIDHSPLDTEVDRLALSELRRLSKYLLK